MNDENDKRMIKGWMKKYYSLIADNIEYSS
jgi:hypothetical protein